MQIDLARFHDSFFQDAEEHLARMEADLIRLEEQAADPELLHDIFRAAHSIKGASATFGFEDLARFTHSLETLLDQVRDGSIEIEPKLVDLLLRSVDVLKGLLDAARSKTPPPAGVEDLIGLLAAAAGRSETEPKTAAGAPDDAMEPPAASTRVYRIRFQPAPELFQQGMDPVLVLRQLESQGTLLQRDADLEGLPPLAVLEPFTCYLAWNLRFETALSEEQVRDLFAFVEDGAVISISPDTAAVEGPPDLPSAPLAAPSAAPQAPAAPTPAREAVSIRVATGKVDKLIDLVGELVIAESIAAQILENFTPSRLASLQVAFSEMQRFTREMQERVMGIRMLPVGTVFSRFPRLVRDLCQITGKQITLEMSGEETELDKTVVEGLADPLTHLIRNAADHGLETAAEREQAGKPPEGRIRLQAYHEGGNVVVEMTDDGRGLSTQAIHGKAVERGLIAPDAALTDAEIHALIFQPGFSTAEAVTGLSGRGVGMDVVRRHVEALNGTVSLTSEAGKGVTVRIKLPLTLAILDGLLVRVGMQSFVLPLVSILESIRPRREQLHQAAGSGEIVVVRGEPIPIVRLHKLFGIATEITDPAAGLLVLVENQGRHLALLVDELLGQQQVVIKSLETHYRKVEGVMGGTILGDGRVALILDGNGLAQMARCQWSAA